MAYESLLVRKYSQVHNPLYSYMYKTSPCSILDTFLAKHSVSLR